MPSRVVFVALLAVFAFAGAVELSEASYNGRSGDFLVHIGAQKERMDGAIAVVRHPEGSPVQAAVLGDLPLALSDVGNVVAQLSGLQSPAQGHVELLAAGAECLLAPRVRANVLVVAEGLDANLVTDAADGKVMSVSTSATVDSIASLATALTSRSPSEHGIVGRTWIDSEGQEVHAYQGVEGQSLAGNVADVASQVSRGKAMTLSVSADAQMAAAGAVHPQLRASLPNLLWAPGPRRDASVHLEDGMVSKMGEEGAALLAAVPDSRDALVRAFASRVGAQVEEREGAVASVAGEGRHGLWNADDKESLDFFAEIALLLASVEGASRAVSKGDAAGVDTITLSVSTLSKLRARHGAGSMIAMRAGAFVASYVVRQVTAVVETAYGHGVVGVQVLCLHSKDTMQQADQEVVKDLHSLLHPYLQAPGVDQFASLLPHVYVSPDVDEATRDKICPRLAERVRAASMTNQVGVHCQEMGGRGRVRRGISLERGIRNVGNSTDIDPNYPIVFNMVLWLSVALIFALVFTSVSIAWMYVPADGVIYQRQKAD